MLEVDSSIISSITCPAGFYIASLMAHQDRGFTLPDDRDIVWTVSPMAILSLILDGNSIIHGITTYHLLTTSSKQRFAGIY